MTGRMGVRVVVVRDCAHVDEYGYHHKAAGPLGYPQYGSHERAVYRPDVHHHHHPCDEEDSYQYHPMFAENQVVQAPSGGGPAAAQEQSPVQ